MLDCPQIRTSVVAHVFRCCIARIHTSSCADDPMNNCSCCALCDIHASSWTSASIRSFGKTIKPVQNDRISRSKRLKSNVTKTVLASWMKTTSPKSIEKALELYIFWDPQLPSASPLFWSCRCADGQHVHLQCFYTYSLVRLDSEGAWNVVWSLMRPQLLEGTISAQDQLSEAIWSCSAGCPEVRNKGLAQTRLALIICDSGFLSYSFHAGGISYKMFQLYCMAVRLTHSLCSWWPLPASPCASYGKKYEHFCCQQPL